MIEKKITVGVIFTPEEIAAEFCGMDSTQQAKFFNEVHRITNEWANSFCFQLQSITDDPNLTDEARRVMEQIGEYARPTTANG